jgi:hypothetical protein
VIGSIVVGVIVLVAGVGWWNHRSRGRIRIIATPPGEAPEEIRRAWIGLELSLVGNGEQPRTLSADGVLTYRPAGVVTGYVVDGKKAIALLASHSPQAADWWRENAPPVTKSGSLLMFPADVCERLG